MQAVILKKSSGVWWSRDRCCVATNDIYDRTIDLFLRILMEIHDLSINLSSIWLKPMQSLDLRRSVSIFMDEWTIDRSITCQHVCLDGKVIDWSINQGFNDDNRRIRPILTKNGVFWPPGRGFRTPKNRSRWDYPRISTGGPSNKYIIRSVVVPRDFPVFDRFYPVSSPKPFFRKNPNLLKNGVRLFSQFRKLHTFGPSKNRVFGRFSRVLDPFPLISTMKSLWIGHRIIFWFNRNRSTIGSEFIIDDDGMSFMKSTAD